MPLQKTTYEAPQAWLIGLKETILITARNFGFNQAGNFCELKSDVDGAGTTSLDMGKILLMENEKI